ncbi:hypothetical protein BDA96_04G114200 [Sorghum bicolor]|uniref:Uncharacterized protein n=1 Tax=Sorghum bicolor TaxID=4558 RepID=A0A921R2Y8_SORBI|nr:hypothetical protein BDA96_04G114200 [Sorghum bicolor]
MVDPSSISSLFFPSMFLFTLHVFVLALLIACTSRLCYVSGDIRHELSTLIGLSGMITELL